MVKTGTKHGICKCMKLCRKETTTTTKSNKHNTKVYWQKSKQATKQMNSAIARCTFFSISFHLIQSANYKQNKSKAQQSKVKQAENGNKIKECKHIHKTLEY